MIKHIVFYALLIMLQCACSPSASSLRGKARLAFAEGEYDKAIGYSKMVIDKKPDDAEILGLYSRALIELNQNAEAVDILGHLISVSGDSALLCYKGTCLNELLQFEKGLNDFKAAIRYDSSLSCAWYGMAKSYTGLGEYGDAIDCLRRVLIFDSANYDALNLIGMNYRYEGQYDMAMKYYHKSIGINTNNWVPYYNLSTLEAIQDKYDSALKHNKIALDLNIGNKPMLTRERGKIYYLIGLNDSACFCWNIARLDNDNEAQGLYLKNCTTTSTRNPE